VKAKLFYVRTLTSTHMGTGRGEGTIDLRIARGAADGIPIVPGSGVKGVLRDEPDLKKLPEHALLFGPEPPSEDAGDARLQQGMLVFNDARLLVLPVRSLKGVTAWVTCPHALRLYADLAGDGVTAIPQLAAQDVLADAATLAHAVNQRPVVMLEEIDLYVANDASNLRAAWQAKLLPLFYDGGTNSLRSVVENRFAIASDEVFAYLCETAMDVRARVRLTEERTVKAGALWYEENLPPESLLYGVWGAQKSRGLDAEQACQKLTAASNPRDAQIGGKSTVGRGMVRLHFGA